jgi:hypothetical protein
MDHCITFIIHNRFEIGSYHSQRYLSCLRQAQLRARGCDAAFRFHRTTRKNRRESMPRDQRRHRILVEVVSQILTSYRQRFVGRCAYESAGAASERPTSEDSLRFPISVDREIERRNINHEFDKRNPSSWGGQWLWIFGVAIHFCGHGNSATPFLHHFVHEY